MTWAETDAMPTGVRSLCPVAPLTTQTHDTGQRRAERHGLSVYAAMIAAVTWRCRCDRLYSEDRPHGLLLDGLLRIGNPFIAAS